MSTHPKRVSFNVLPSTSLSNNNLQTSAGAVTNTTSWFTYIISNWKFILAILAILFFIIFAYVMYTRFTKSLVTNFHANREGITTNDTNSSKIAEIMLFYADWCPHCKSSKPVWESIKSIYENKNVNGYNVMFTEVNCTDTDNPTTEKIMNQYKIKGFPTILLVKDNQVIQFDGSINKNNLDEFINTAL